MRMHMRFNERHGEYEQYEHGDLVFCGYFYHGIQYGIATKIDKKNNRTYNVQYVDGNVEYELLNDDEENTLVRKNGDKIIEQSCYLIHNFRSIPEFCPEGYSVQRHLLPSLVSSGPAAGLRPAVCVAADRGGLFCRKPDKSAASAAQPRF